MSSSGFSDEYKEIARFLVNRKEFSGTVPLRLVYRMDQAKANDLYHKLWGDGIIGKKKGSILTIPLMSTEQLERFFELSEMEMIPVEDMQKTDKVIIVNATMKKLGYENIIEDTLFDFIAYKDGKKCRIQIGKGGVYSIISLLLKRQISDAEEVILLSGDFQEQMVSLASHLNIKCCQANGEFVKISSSAIKEELRAEVIEILTDVAGEKDRLNQLFADNGLCVKANAVNVNEKSRKYLLKIDKEELEETMRIVQKNKTFFEGKVKVILENRLYYVVIEE